MQATQTRGTGGRASSDPFGVLSRVGQSTPDLSSEGRGWDGVVLQCRPFAPHEMRLPPLEDHLIVVADGGTCRLRQERDGRVREASLVRGSAVLMPAGQESGWRQEGRGRVLHLGLAPSFVEGVAEQSGADPDRFELLNDFGTHDPRIAQVADALRSELDTEGLGGRVYAESLANVLAIHLLRNHSSLGRDPVRELRGGLPKLALRRTTEYVEDNLACGITLAEMAGTANVSAYHFTRLFKRSTGLPPHQYVIRRRVEKAKALLIGTELPVGEVAPAVGFSNHGHLSRHFKRVVGATPGVFRARARR